MKQTTAQPTKKSETKTKRVFASGPDPIADFRKSLAGQKFGTILADPPWQFTNRTGKVAPEHLRLARYQTMSQEEICALPVADVCAPVAHLYLWCPNAMLPWGLDVLNAWGWMTKPGRARATGRRPLP